MTFLTEISTRVPKRGYFLIAPICLVLISLVVSPGLGASPAATTQEILITAARAPLSISDQPNTVRSIDRSVIERSGVDTVNDLLRQFGSIQISDNSGIDTSARVSLRGFSTAQNVMVLVDGHKLNNSDLGGADLRAVNINEIERVEILEGGAGALYGDQAVAGVINILTHRDQRRDGLIRIARGSYDQESYTASYGDSFASGFYYRADGEVERSDAYRAETALNRERGKALIGYRHQAGKAFIEGGKADSEYLLTGPLTTPRLAADRRQAGSSFNDYRTTRDNWRGGIEQQLSDRLQILAHYSERNEHAMIRARSSFGNTVSTQDRRARTFDPRLIYRDGPLRLTLGYDRELVDYDFGIDFGFGPSLTRQRHQKSAEYLHVLYRPLPQLSLQGALRHARAKVAVQPYALDYERSATVHHLGSAWQADNWRLYINRDETFRFPLADENVDFLGNLNLLDVQRGVAWELGGVWSRPGLELNLALFQQDNRDEIGFDVNQGLFGANTNLDDTRRRGLSTEAKWQARPDLQLKLFYTYTDARFKEGPYQNKRIPDVPRQLVKLFATYQLKSQLDFSAELLYVGARQLDFANTDSALGGYTVTNLALRWRHRDWTLHTRLNNVTAKEYTEFVSFFGTRGYYPSAERNMTLSLSYAL